MKKQTQKKKKMKIQSYQQLILKFLKIRLLFFELRKYDDMFSVIKEFCKKNNLNEKVQRFLPLIIIKALNSIYGIMNLKLTSEEIVYINELKEKYL